MVVRRLQSRLADVSLFGLAVVEVTIRSIGDIIPTVIDFLTTLLVLLFPLVNDRTMVAWVIGWMFLATLAYRANLSMYAVKDLNGVPDKDLHLRAVAVAALSVGLAVVTKYRIIEVWFEHGSSTPSVVAQNIWLIMGFCFLIYSLFNMPLLLKEDMGFLWLVVTDSPRMLIFSAPALAFAATLYPLPEVAVVVWIIAAVGINTVPFGPQIHSLLNDPVERFTYGVTAAQSEFRGYITFLYIYAGILLSLVVVIGFEGSTQLLIMEILRDYSHITTSIFFLIGTFGPAIYGFWYWLRLVERLPFEFDVLSSPSASQMNIHKTNSSDGVGAIEFRSLPPAFGVQTLLLIGPLGVYAAFTGSGTSIPSESLPPPLGYILAAVLVAIIAIMTVVWTRRRDPVDQLSVEVVAPLSFTLHLWVYMLIGTEPIPTIFHGLLTTDPIPHIGFGLIFTVIESTLVAGIFLIPAVITLYIMD